MDTNGNGWLATQYGDKADSLMLLCVETFTNSAAANGIAYKCF